MGVDGLWKVLALVEQVKSLIELAVTEGFVRNQRGTRTIVVGIDASIWIHQLANTFHSGHAQAGENPELRTLFFKLARLLSLPLTPIFVFDGAGRPALKRGVQVIAKPSWLVKPMCDMIEAFGFPHYTAAGEAEAELAKLNELGMIDAVITEDVDAFLFGANHVIRLSDLDTIKIYSIKDISSRLSITRGGMILIALLAGGDYDPAGLRQCGIAIAQRLAQTSLGDTLLDAALTLSDAELTRFLVPWRQRLRLELSTNMSGKLMRKHPLLAQGITESFPDCEVLQLYARPLTTWLESGVSETLAVLCPTLRRRAPDIPRLVQICERRFGWENHTSGSMLSRFHVVWDGICVQMLCDTVLDSERKVLTSRTSHFNVNAIQRIRSSKQAPAPARDLKMYRVAYSTWPLVQTTSLASTSKTDTVGEADSAAMKNHQASRLVWIPASIVEATLPGMVVDYYRKKDPGFRIQRGWGQNLPRPFFKHPTANSAKKTIVAVIDLTDEDSDNESGDGRYQWHCGG